MNRQLFSVLAAFEVARDRCHRIAAATPDERWATRRDPGRWSVAECIVHLNLTGESYVPLLRHALAAYPPVHPPPRRYRRDPIGWIVGFAVGPLPRIGGRRLGRVATAAAFVPGGDMDRDTVMRTFDALQDEQVRLVREADGRPLGAIRIASPFDARVKYNAFSCLAMLPRHQRRHLEQAEEVWGTLRT